MPANTVEDLQKTQYIKLQSGAKRHERAVQVKMPSYVSTNTKEKKIKKKAMLEAKKVKMSLSLKYLPTTELMSTVISWKTPIALITFDACSVVNDLVIM